MTIETATYIHQLDASLPTPSDFISEGDDHLRKIKAALQATFPNVAGVVTVTHAQVNNLASVTADELGRLAGVTAPIQSQFDGKASLSGDTYTGLHDFSGASGVTLPGNTSIGAVTSVQIGYLSGVTSSIQSQINGKASLSGATYTGTHDLGGATAVTLPGATSIGTVTAAEIGRLSGVTSDIQGQFNALSNAKANKSGDTYTGAHDFTAATLTAATPAAGDATGKVATTAFVASTAFASSLPGQAGNAGKVISTNGTAAFWLDLKTIGLKLSASTTYTWNGDGTLASSNADGITTTYTWYADGRINTAAFPYGGKTRTETYNWDATDPNKLNSVTAVEV